MSGPLESSYSSFSGSYLRATAVCMDLNAINTGMNIIHSQMAGKVESVNGLN